MRYILILFLFTVTIVHAEPECIYCHSSLEDYMTDPQTTCDDCHSISIPSHVPTKCGVCHGVSSKDRYHQLHSDVPCETCHADSKVPKGISYSSCISCHTNKTNGAHTKGIIEPQSLAPNKSWEKFSIYSVLKVLYQQVILNEKPIPNS